MVVAPIGETHTNARRLRFHCCNCSFGINQGETEYPSVSLVDSWLLKSSFSNKIDEYLSSRGLHKPKSESFKWPVLSSIRLSGLISLQAEYHWLSITHFTYKIYLLTIHFEIFLHKHVIYNLRKVWESHLYLRFPLFYSISAFLAGWP